LTGIFDHAIKDGKSCDHASDELQQLLTYDPEADKRELLDARGGAYSAFEEDYESDEDTSAQ